MNQAKAEGTKMGVPAGIPAAKSRQPLGIGFDPFRSRGSASSGGASKPEEAEVP